MGDTTTSTGPVAASAAALARQIILALGAYAVGAGWVTADQLPGIATLVISFGSAAWGLYKTHQRQTRITVTEAATGVGLKST